MNHELVSNCFHKIRQNSCGVCKSNFSIKVVFMKTKHLIELYETYGAHNYHPLPVVMAKGKGAKVYDVDGNEFLDFLSCYAALNFGHQHPQLVSVMKKQLNKLSLCSRAFYSEELALFSKELAKFCKMEAVLTMNSGSEAVETALKISRKWGYEKKKVPLDKAKIIAMANNFHGRTITIISLSTTPVYRDRFGPYTSGFTIVPYDDLEAVKRVIDHDTVAVLLEPIQAEAGILVPSPGYLSKLRQICSQAQVLMVLDEIQTGFGRTGKEFCYQHENVTPDILILGKALGGGLLPISAVLSNRTVMDVIRPGEHGSTFGGNPLACRVGREVLKLLRTEKLTERAKKMGEIAIGLLSEQKLKKVREVRGKGLLIGIELYPSAGGARKYCEMLLKVGVLCKETHEHVIRIAPPLMIAESLLRQGLKKVIEILK